MKKHSAEFEAMIRAEYAAMHLMNEMGHKLPVDLYIHEGYKLRIVNPNKWNAIQKNYDFEIRRCLKRGIGDRKNFKFKKLETDNQ